MTKYNVSPLVAREIEFSTGTIQVHFNDESLFIIITMTGQY